MTEKQKFYTKLLLFMAVIFTAQMCFYRAAGMGHYSRQRGILNKVDRQLSNGTRIFYFGDSTVISICPEDEDQRSLFDALQEELEDLTLAEVAHAAFSLTQYEPIMKYLARQSRGPRLIVVPVNIRSFSTQWDLRPDWQFQKEKIFACYDHPLFRAFYEPLTKFKAPSFNLTPITMEDYLGRLVYDGAEVVGKTADFYIDYGNPPENPDLRRQFIWCYMHSILPEHRKSKSLQEIARTTRETGFKAVFYVSPLDFESGRRLLGQRFETRLEENVAMLSSLLMKEGANILDYSRLLPTSMFCPPSFCPNEHMTAEGRSILAREIATAIRSRLQNRQAD